jgi:Helicase HerA, central domain
MVPDSQLFEKLGAFYLGRRFDPATDATTDDLVLYDAKDLTTHAVCVGMTGSGKTGLCVSLLEEAAIDGIPAIVIDPKGDLANLLLTFPTLDASAFRPWIDESEAARRDLTPDAYATQVAETWRDGLARWGQGPDRIERLRAAAECAIYTPGSTAGRPLTVLKSFGAPPQAVRTDAEALRERVASAVAGLLALLGIDADPVRSREHILLANILHEAWQGGRDLDIAGIIGQVQKPPFAMVGVMPVETFFPQADRFDLAMRINGLLASPGFAAWMEGEPLDVPGLLWSPEGRPRVAILSIAHLSDAERMFFVTLLLNEVVTWMRAQPGTPSLRAILYMDEVFGYFPPTANPPSKIPMLTLLKQARAYGVGVVLATQNPVDLDYKGLSNTGTWFIGRLQTERDKMRVLEGLEGASASVGGGFDRGGMERTLAGLKSRVFLMHNVHEDAPVVFHTRWAMSYLRGPLTRAQIQQLAESAAPVAPPTAAGGAAPAAAAPVATAPVSAPRPVAPPEAGETFVVPVGAPPAGGRLLYRPALLGTVDLHFVSAKDDVDEWQTATFVAPIDQGVGASPWADAARHDVVSTQDTPAADAVFAKLPARAASGKTYGTWERALKTHVYKEAGLSMLQCREFKLASRPGETRAEFLVRLRETAREQRDETVEKLRRKYAPKVSRLQEQIRKAEERVGRERSEYDQQKLQTAVSMGATVLGALLGRKAVSVGTIGRATTAARGVSRTAKQKGDIERARRDLEARQEKLRDLETQLQAETAELQQSSIETLEIVEREIKPRKTDIAVSRVALAWLPWWLDSTGAATPAHG